MHTDVKTRDIVTTAVFAALICAAAPFSVPVGPVPVSLATLMIYIASGVLGRTRASVAVLVYIALGAIGLPVFSGFSGGISKIFGVTGGYIIGYLPLAFISGAFSGFSGRRAWLYPAGMVLGTLALYALGTAWFMFQTGNPLLGALGMCVLPFLPGDAGKIAIAALVSPAVRRRVGR
ncbi:MAG: biotin transporter BioY [Oscillospiraceae bacterium]|jgi:biotin transport system substrate-specific component|nr:biotin transporter BioY [Oscillospiraceae bacterium]